jgi:hypothetical protein
MPTLRTKQTRAPAGARQVLGKVESYIRNHPDKAAKYLGVSDSTARKVRHAVESGKPLSSVVKTQAGLDKWKERLTDAKRLSRAENVAKRVAASSVPTERMENVSTLTKQEMDKALSKAKKGLPVEPGVMREISRALKETQQQEPYQEKGVWIYPNIETLDRDVAAGDWPQAVTINRFSPFKSDIVKFIEDISTAYFVAVWEQSEEMYFIWDIRAPGEKR